MAITRNEPAIHEMSVARLSTVFREEGLSPVVVVEACREVRERRDPQLNAFCQVRPDETRHWAERAEARLANGRCHGPLMGVPLAVKDDLALAGWPLHKGSRLTTDEPIGRADQSPTVIALRRAGMVVAGRTTLPEFGWKATTDSPRTGVTRNPWNPRLTPGGSSGGNAAALATGMVPAAVGTDIGGSVRIPAAFCGVVGFKPTQTVMSGNADAKTGLLLHSGPMARTVEDVAMLMSAAGSQDPDRPLRPGEDSRFIDSLHANVGELRIGVSPGLGFAQVDAEIESAVREAADVLAGLGATVERVDVLEESPIETYELLYMPQLTEDVDQISVERRSELDPGLVAMAQAARDITAADFVRGLKQRRRLIERMAGLHDHYDVILSATVPIFPFEVERDVPEGYPEYRWWSWTPLTLTFNLTGQPAISVPCGRSSRGLPIGLQMTGPHNRDDLVLRAAFAYQMNGYWPQLAPAGLRSSRAECGETAVQS